jgi:hypothetical protein
MPPWPLVLGSDAVKVGAVATRGEFLWSVKAVTAITMTIAAMTPAMAPLPQSPSRPVRFGIGFCSLEGYATINAGIELPFREAGLLASPGGKE